MYNLRTSYVTLHHKKAATNFMEKRCINIQLSRDAIIVYSLNPSERYSVYYEITKR